MVFPKVHIKDLKYLYAPNVYMCIRLGHFQVVITFELKKKIHFRYFKFTFKKMKIKLVNPPFKI